MVHVSEWQFLKDQWTPAAPVEKADLTGKTVLVLGANTGIGYEAAKHFATMKPARLVMACRSQERGAAAVASEYKPLFRLPSSIELRACFHDTADIKQSTGFDAELWLIDLCSFASVKAFVDKFEKEVERLDILVANAAIISTKYETTEDGWETSCVLFRFYAPFVLTLIYRQDSSQSPGASSAHLPSTPANVQGRGTILF